MRPLLNMVTAVALALMVLACDELPRDPEGTLAEVRRESLRVGIVENPPWTHYQQQTAAGVEVELVEAFAAELGVPVQWIHGGESELMTALERFELHLVIGGLTNTTPWIDRVGLSRVYFTNRFVVGVPPGRHLETIADVPVAVREGSPVAAMARERDAQVVPVADLSGTEVEAVAAPVWQLERLGRAPTAIELHRDEHVMAVPPGENGWLMRLDRFLHRKGGTVPDRLRQTEVGP